MSIIKGDGGGTQYTFLEAIYHDCALILHEEWVKQGSLFKDKYNCYVIHTGDEGKQIAEILQSPLNETYETIIKNSKKLLQEHMDIHWF